MDKMRPPTISLIVFTYNQADYIGDAILGALSQTYSPIEIIVSDDCSSDGTYETIKETIAGYNGPHKLILNRNEENLGLIGHINKVFGMASGDIVVISSGDDISLPHRTQKLVDLYVANGGGPILFHGDVIKIDQNGNKVGLLKAGWGKAEINLEETALRDALYIGASAALTRELLNKFPPISYKKAYEDLVWGFRAALLDAVIYVEEPLIMYRVEVGLSWELKKNAEDSFLNAIEKDKRKLAVLKDVYRQRMMDLEHADKHLMFKSLHLRLEEKHFEAKVDLEILQGKTISLLRFLCRPRTLLQRIKSIRKYKRRLLKNQIKAFHN